MTQAAFDRAIAFVREHPDKPFYLNVWSPLPHAPLRPRPEQRAAYRDLKPDPKAFGKWMADYLQAAKSPAEQMKTYLAAIAEVDRQVGRLRAELAQLKLPKTPSSCSPATTARKTTTSAMRPMRGWVRRDRYAGANAASTKAASACPSSPHGRAGFPQAGWIRNHHVRRGSDAHDRRTCGHPLRRAIH